MNKIIQTIKKYWFPVLMGIIFVLGTFSIIMGIATKEQRKSVYEIKINCQNEITEADVRCIIRETKFGNRSASEAFENLESESIWKGEDLMTRDEVINIIKKMDEEKNLMDELYFLDAVDGSVSEPTFVPFFCEIYNQCQNKK